MLQRQVDVVVVNGLISRQRPVQLGDDRSQALQDPAQRIVSPPECRYLTPKLAILPGRAQVLLNLFKRLFGLKRIASADQLQELSLWPPRPVGNPGQNGLRLEAFPAAFGVKLNALLELPHAQVVGR